MKNAKAISKQKSSKTKAKPSKNRRIKLPGKKGRSKKEPGGNSGAWAKHHDK